MSLVIGVAAGMLGGMFGIGGGLLMVPAMAMLMHFPQHKAQGTSLAVLMVPVALPAVVNYFKQGNIDIKTAAIIAFGFFFGGFFGSKLSLNLNEITLKKSFAVFLVVVAIQMWFQAEAKSKKIALTTEPPASAQELGSTDSK